MTVALSVAIQHHPRRADILPGLLAQLGEPADVVADPEPLNAFPSPWRTYRRALELSPTGCTHRLILQDDVELCDRFLPTVRSAIRAQPDRLLALFVPGQFPGAILDMPAASMQGSAWLELRSGGWCPAVALVWPAQLAFEMLYYANEQAWPPGKRADDENIGQFLSEHGHQALATLPCLVEHPDIVESVTNLTRARGGEDPGRLAVCFAGSCDTSQIDWSAGPL